MVKYLEPLLCSPPLSLVMHVPQNPRGKLFNTCVTSGSIPVKAAACSCGVLYSLADKEIETRAYKAPYPAC